MSLELQNILDKLEGVRSFQVESGWGESCEVHINFYQEHVDKAEELRDLLAPFNCTAKISDVVNAEYVDHPKYEEIMDKLRKYEDEVRSMLAEYEIEPDQIFNMEEIGFVCEKVVPSREIKLRIPETELGNVINCLKLHITEL